MSNTAQLIRFTVNVGVASTRLLEFFSNTRRGPSLGINDCQLHERLGFLIPDHKDKWWEVTAGAVPVNLVTEMSDLMTTIVIPYISENSSDESLRDLWLSGKSPGLTNLSRLTNLNVLLSALGPPEAQESVLREFQEESKKIGNTFVMARYLKRLQMPETQ